MTLINLVQHLVTMLKLLGLLVRACSRPGPEATTLLGSHPSVTDTLKGLFGTCVSSYRTWTLCTPEWRRRRSQAVEEQCALCTHVQCLTILKGSVLHAVGSVGLVSHHTFRQGPGRVLDFGLDVVSAPLGERAGVYSKLCGGFPENT